jgi:hypothetical protein
VLTESLQSVGSAIVTSLVVIAITLGSLGAVINRTIATGLMGDDDGEEFTADWRSCLRENPWRQPI